MAEKTEVQTVPNAVVAPDVENAALSWPDKSSLMVIQDQASYDSVTEALLNIKRLAGEIKDHHRPVITAAHAAHKAACDAEKRLLTPLIQAEGILKGKVATWMQDQERKRLEEQKRLEEEARKQADDEALAAAQQAHEDGASMEDALAVLDEAESFVQPVIAAPTYVKKAAVGITYRWEASVESLMELVKAVASGKVAITYIQADMVKLNGQAKVSQDAMNIPGVKAVKKPVVSARR